MNLFHVKGLAIISVLYDLVLLHQLFLLNYLCTVFISCRKSLLRSNCEGWITGRASAEKIQHLIVTIWKFAFGNKEHITDRKCESQFHWDSSEAVINFATPLTPSSIYMSSTPFSKISKWVQWSKMKWKYNLHFGEVLGDILWLPHGTKDKLLWSTIKI